MTNAVSVLVPTYNRAHFIEESLDSLLGQTVAPSQVIVIDDGSTDDTAARVARYGERVTYLRKENAGKSSAVNLAMPQVTGDFVWIFDDDDAAYPDAIARHLAVLNDNPALGFTCSDYAAAKSGPDGKVVFERLMPPLALVTGRRIFLDLLRHCHIPLSGTIARLDCYRRVGAFREDMKRGQDYDMLIRLARFHAGQVLPGATYLHRRHDGPRGTASERHAESERHTIWRAYDKVIGATIRRELGLPEYLLTVPGEKLTDGQRREALLSRASVMANKGMIAEMFEDLGRAAALTGAGPISESERAVARSFCVHDNFVYEASRTPGFLRRLCGLTASPFGAAVVSSIGRSCYWDLRSPTARKGHALWLLTAASTLMLAPRARIRQAARMPGSARAGDYATSSQDAE